MGDSESTLLAAVAFIERQRKLADSPDPLERAQTLWVATELNKRLSRCTDAQIAELLARAEERLPIWEPEFAVIEHARRRLLSSRQLGLLPESDVFEAVRDEGIHILNTEVALYRASIPHLLLPFQTNRFASDMVMVPDVQQARACLIAGRFREDVAIRSILIDADTDKPVRLLQER